MTDQLFYPHIRWNFTLKFLVRFAVVFFALQILPILSFIGDDLYPWVAKHVFSINEMSLEYSGSGDMYYNYMELFFCFCLAVFASIVWSCFNKKEKNYDTLLHYFLIFIRYYLAMSMISYGYAKVFYNQFGAPGLGRLLQPYGDSSPMGIAWTFIGASKPYTVFSGLAELTGGVLLLFRRTTLLGSIISFSVMLNVMMLNFCYDVPVKLYSTQLVILSLIVIACNGNVLWSALWSHKATEAEYYKPLFQKKIVKIAALIIKCIVVIYFVVIGGYNQYQSVYDNGPDAPKAPLYGIYKPTELIKNNDTLKLFSDSTEWKHLVIEYKGYASIRQLNDRKIKLAFNVDTLKKTIDYSDANDSLMKGSFKYAVLNDTTLNIKGIYKTDTINYTLGKVNVKAFRLINRGFHWVNEVPYNR